MIRPLIVKLVGPGGKWDHAWVREQAADFFKGRLGVTRGDIGVWVTRVLHQVHVGITLTEAEGEEFMDMQVSLWRVGAVAFGV